MSNARAHKREQHIGIAYPRVTINQRQRQGDACVRVRNPFRRRIGVLRCCLKRIDILVILLNALQPMFDVGKYIYLYR